MSDPIHDLHVLEPLLSATDLMRVVDRAISERFRAIVVAPVHARSFVEALRGTGVSVRSVVGYPLGISKPTVKAIEATSLAKDGVDALEVTPLPTAIRVCVLDRDEAPLRNELLEIARGARAARPTIGLHLRVDVTWLEDAEPANAIAALASTIARGAFDGLVLDGEITAWREALRAATSIERKARLDGAKYTVLADRSESDESP